MHAWNVFVDAWKNRKALGDGAKTRDLAAFLPAALEIQAAPPHPLAKWLARSLIILFSFGILWAIFGEVNIVASAEGKIIPSAKVKQIQPLEKAVVKKILVADGDIVEQGQPLIELDATLTHAEEQRLKSDLLSAQYQLRVSQTFLSLLDLPETQQVRVTFADLKLLPLKGSFSGDENQTPQNDNLYTRLLWQYWQDYRAQFQLQHSSLSKNKSEQAATQEIVIKLEQTLPIINKRAKSMQDLHQKNYASENDYLQLEQERIQAKQDLAAQREQLNSLKAAQSEISQQLASLKAQFSGNQLSQIAEINRQVTSLQEELAKATDLNDRRILYAPVAGQVQQLVMNTVGGVVTEAQPLMVIVPNDEQLEVEVSLENKDIGFVREGMPAEIKIHTFPFTKYGVIEGEVITVSDDAIVDEQRGLIYTMRVKMHKNTLLVNGKNVKLMPGMAVTAEVQTDKRRLIEFFMAPLLRYQQEGLRER